MSTEGFAQVFAPSADKVQENCEKHQKLAHECWAMAICFTLSLAACVYFMFGKADGVFTNIALNRVIFGAISVEVIGLVAAVVRAIYHGNRAEHYAESLANEYIHRKQRWDLIDPYE